MPGHSQLPLRPACSLPANVTPLIRTHWLRQRTAWITAIAAMHAALAVTPAGGQPPSGIAEQLATATMKAVDLTHPFDERTIFWPTEPGFRLERAAYGVTPQGYFYAANRFSTAEHGGTHLDAPIHFFRDRHTVDQIPLERLMGEAVVIDVSQACRGDRDYQVQVADLRAWEERHGRQLVDVIVLLRTGFGAYWPDAERYLGTAAKGETAVGQLHFPGLDPLAAKWLAEQRSVKAVGIDTASIDYGQSRRFQSHVTLFEHNVPVFENVANLDRLPEAGAWVVALPMKIAGGSGAPLRIVALVDEAD